MFLLHKNKKNDIIHKLSVVFLLSVFAGCLQGVRMLEVKTKSQMRTIRKDKVICYLLNGKRDYEKEKRISKLLYDVLKTFE